ncbi:MAG: phosphoglycolate phosphatase [Burkholderiales bacterium]
MFDLVMFDLDGTLVDTAPDICGALNATLREFGLPGVPESLVKHWIGQGTQALLERACARATEASSGRVRSAKSIDGVLAAFERHYVEHCGRRSKPFPMVVSSLRGLRGFGVRTALLTNKEQRFAVEVLHAHRLRHYFDPIVAGDTLPEKKPSAVPVRYCLQRCGVRPERALLVGDSSIDVETARNAGVAVWAVPYGYNRGRPIAESKPDRVIPSLASVLEAVASKPRPERKLA